MATEPVTAAAEQNVKITERVSRMDQLEVREYLDGVRHWHVPLSGTRTTVECETRAADNGKAELRISGYAAVFDSDSEPIMGMFTERIQRGAFKKALKGEPDMRLLVNHTGLPYARTTNGTLTVVEEAKGLRYDAILAPTRESETLHTLIERGDVTQNSFAFRVERGTDVWECACGDPLGWECDCGPDEVVRTITSIEEAPEVSVVTFPAYQATSVQTDGGSPGERNVQAIDVEQREAANSESSTPDADIALSIRTFLFLQGVETNESSIERST